MNHTFAELEATRRREMGLNAEIAALRAEVARLRTVDDAKVERAIIAMLPFLNTTVDEWEAETTDMEDMRAMVRAALTSVLAVRDKP